MNRLSSTRCVIPWMLTTAMALSGCDQLFDDGDPLELAAGGVCTAGDTASCDCGLEQEAGTRWCEEDAWSECVCESGEPPHPPGPGASCDHDAKLADRRDGVDRSEFDPIPEACYPMDLPDGIVLLPIKGGYYTKPVRTALTVEIAGGEVVSVDGMACDMVTEGLSKSYSPCRLRMVCGCCVFSFVRVAWDYRSPGQLEFRLDYAGGLSDSSCSGIYRGYYEVDLSAGRDKGGAGGIGGPAPASDACSDCLSSCQGQSACCTGTGCLCNDACGMGQAQNCAPPTFRCCGPDGFCLCLSDCPY